MGGLRQSPHNFRRVALLGWKDSKVGTLSVTAHDVRGEDVLASGVSGTEHFDRAASGATGGDSSLSSPRQPRLVLIQPAGNGEPPLQSVNTRRHSMGATDYGVIWCCGSASRGAERRWRHHVGRRGIACSGSRSMRPEYFAGSRLYTPTHGYSGTSGRSSR